MFNSHAVEAANLITMNAFRTPKFRKLTLALVTLAFWFAQVQTAIACMTMDAPWLDVCGATQETPGAGAVKAPSDCCALSQIAPATSATATTVDLAHPALKTATQPTLVLLQLSINDLYATTLNPTPPSNLIAPRDAGAGIVLNTLRIRV